VSPCGEIRRECERRRELSACHESSFQVENGAAASRGGSLRLLEHALDAGETKVAEQALPMTRWVPPFRATRELEPRRVWVDPSLFGMSTYRTMRSGLSSEYGIGVSEKFTRLTLPPE
jgi:hypothetical protein